MKTIVVRKKKCFTVYNQAPQCFVSSLRKQRSRYGNSVSLMSTENKRNLWPVSRYYCTVFWTVIRKKTLGYHPPSWIRAKDLKTAKWNW